jgi:CBS domain-containing protein
MTLSAKDVRLAKVVTVEPDEPLREVATTVVKNRIHRVLVAQDCRLLGVISSRDLVAQIAATGVMSTPAVVIDGKVVHSGGVPSKSKTEEWLRA